MSQVSYLPAFSSVKWIQSGGFADVFLADGIVYKVFNQPGFERREFDVVKYLMTKYSQGCYMSHVAQYYGFGYAHKDQILNMYNSCDRNGSHKVDINKIIKNYSKFNVVPYICMEFVPGIDGLVSISYHT